MNYVKEWQDLKPEEQRIPIHEAGHSTLYGACPEYEIEGASMYPRRIRGEMHRAHVQLRKTPPRCFRSCVGSLVGLAAEKVLLGITYAPNFESNDILHARQTATIVGGDDWANFMHEARGAAERFARANRLHIESLAQTFYRRGELDGFRIAVRINQLINQLGPLTAIPPRDRPERRGIALPSDHDGIFRRIDGYIGI
jgi:hypothetical protein